MRHADVRRGAHRHAGGLQRRGVAQAVVADRVVLGDLHEGTRQPAEVGGVQRRGVRLPRVLTAEVVVAEGDAVGLAEDRRVRVLVDRGARQRQVGRRVEQALEGDGRSGAVAGHEADDRREVAAGAVAHHGDPRRVGAELGSARDEVDERRVAVVGRRRPAVGRRQPVVDRHHDRADRCGHGAAQPVGALVRAEHPAPAVHVHDEREVALRALRRDVRAGAHRPRRPGRRAVRDPHAGRETAEDGVEHGVVARLRALLQACDAGVVHACDRHPAQRPAEQPYAQVQVCHRATPPVSSPVATPCQARARRP